MLTVDHQTILKCMACAIHITFSFCITKYVMRPVKMSQSDEKITLNRSESSILNEIYWSMICIIITVLANDGPTDFP